VVGALPLEMDSDEHTPDGYPHDLDAMDSALIDDIPVIRVIRVVPDDGDEAVFSEDVVENFDLHYCRPSLLPPIHIPETTHEKVRRHLVNGNSVVAASFLVHQASCQTGPLSATPPMALGNIMLFLYLARLIMSCGVLQQYNLSKVLGIMYPYTDMAEPGWTPMPSTVEGFKKQILNVSNANSFVSLLPIPQPETMEDGHSYTPIRSIFEHALTTKCFKASETKDPKWGSIVSCPKFVEFLDGIAAPTGTLSALVQLAIGLLVWTDGWDTSTGCKSNRSPMHTGTVTMVIVDVLTRELVGIATYPNMGGPGKINHGGVFHRFKKDLDAFQQSKAEDRIFDSSLTRGKVVVQAKIMFVVQDQPERRQASGLLGGGSTLHPLFGTSCDFLNLDTSFPSCPECETSLQLYLEVGDWTNPPSQDMFPRRPIFYIFQIVSKPL
jgi:hypothetical protein